MYLEEINSLTSVTLVRKLPMVRNAIAADRSMGDDSVHSLSIPTYIDVCVCVDCYDDIIFVLELQSDLDI